MFLVGIFQIRVYLFRVLLVLGALSPLTLVWLAPEDSQRDRRLPANQEMQAIQREAPSDLSTKRAMLPPDFWIQAPPHFFESIHLNELQWQELLKRASSAHDSENWSEVDLYLRIMLLNSPTSEIARAIRDQAGYAFWVKLIDKAETRDSARELLKLAQ